MFCFGCGADDITKRERPKCKAKGNEEGRNNQEPVRKPLTKIISPSFSEAYNNIVAQGGKLIQQSEVSRLDRVLGVNTKVEESVEIIRMDDRPDFKANHSELPMVVFNWEEEPLPTVVEK